MRTETNQIILDRCTELGISLETARSIGKESGYGDGVSYRTTMPEEALVWILASGEVPQAFAAHVSHLLDDAPAQILVMAAEQAALQAGQSVAAIWTNIFDLAKTTGSLRPSAWKVQG